MFKRILTSILPIIIITSIGVGVYANIQQERAIDKSKLPTEVEQNIGFQKWITNLKNKDFIIEADEFRLKEENEIYNTQWTKVDSINQDNKKEEYDEKIDKMKDIKKVIFSPSDRSYIDYRPEIREQFSPNEVHFYGLRDDKIIDARIVDCSVAANCYFDRAFFIDNDVFVISELSRNIEKRDKTAPPCLPTDECVYTFKLHVIDLVNNSRAVYQSKEFNLILSEVMGEI